VRSFCLSVCQLLSAPTVQQIIVKFSVRYTYKICRAAWISWEWSHFHPNFVWSRNCILTRTSYIFYPIAHIFYPYCPYFSADVDGGWHRKSPSSSFELMWVQPQAVQHNTTSVAVAMKCHLCSVHFSSHYAESFKRDTHKLYWGNVNFLKVSAMNALLYQPILATFIGRCGRNLVEAVCTWYSWASVSFVYVVIKRLAFACGRKSKYVCARTVKQNDILRGQNTLATSVSCHLYSRFSSEHILSATTRKSKL